MKINKIIRAVCFFIILALVFSCLLNVFQIDVAYHAPEINSFYAQPENSLDVVLIGASGIYRGWSNMTAWKNYGITSYAWSTDAQPISAAKYIIKDILKTQSPKLFLIDYRMTRNEVSKNDFFIRKVADNMPPSQNRIDAINGMLDLSANPTEYNRFEYYFSFLLYHSRWEEGLTPHDFSDKLSDTNGTRVSNVLFKTEPQTRLSYPTDETEEIDPKTKEIFIDLCKFCKDNSLPVLFLCMPFNISEEERKLFNDTEQLLEQYELPYLDLNDDFESIGLNLSTDYYESNHTNINGMIKTTNYLAAYLQDKYALPDHRGEPELSHWDKCYKTYYNQVRSSAEKNEFKLEPAAEKEFQSK